MLSCVCTPNLPLLLKIMLPIQGVVAAIRNKETWAPENVVCAVWGFFSMIQAAGKGASAVPWHTGAAQGGHPGTTPTPPLCLSAPPASPQARKMLISSKVHNFLTP